MARDISRYLEVRADLRRVLPAVHVTQSNSDWNWFIITGSAKRGMFTVLEYNALQLVGLHPYQDTCEASGDEIQDAVEKLLLPCGG